MKAVLPHFLHLDPLTVFMNYSMQQVLNYSDNLSWLFCQTEGFPALFDQ